MDGYNAMIRISKEKPEYISIVKKCVESHHDEEKKQYSLGFELSDVRVWPVKLALLATKYDLLKVTYKSNSTTFYMVSDIEGVEKALQDIESGRIAKSAEGIVIRVWLSAATMNRLGAYIARELSDHWDPETLIVERALNSFLDRITP
jgi:hypothetical protein